MAAQTVDRDKDRSYYRLPAIITRSNEKKQGLSRERRATWLARIRRKDLSSEAGEFVRVCSDHFISGKRKNISDRQSAYGCRWSAALQDFVVMADLSLMPCVLSFSGKPSSIYDKDSPDWAPSHYLGHSYQKVSASSEERHKRTQERSEKRKRSESAMALLELSKEIKEAGEPIFDDATSKACQTEANFELLNEVTMKAERLERGNAALKENL